jgi:hemolysin III
MQATSEQIDIRPPAGIEAVKPSLRGVSHQFAFFFAIVAAVLLVRAAPPGAPSLAATAFGVSLVTLFGVSALYHRKSWSDVARMRMAAWTTPPSSYSSPAAPPLFTVLPGESHGAPDRRLGRRRYRRRKVLAWPAPKWDASPSTRLAGERRGVRPCSNLSTATIAVSFPAVPSTASGARLRQAAARPPLVFGYHEVFHALVIVASILSAPTLRRAAHGEQGIPRSSGLAADSGQRAARAFIAPQEAAKS